MNIYHLKNINYIKVSGGRGGGGYVLELDWV